MAAGRGQLRVREVDLTANGSGAATASVGLPTCELEGIDIVLGTATTADITVDNLGRHLYNVAAVNSSRYVPFHDGAVKPDGTAITNSFVEAVVHGTVSITLANATANGTLKVLLYYR